MAVFQVEQPNLTCLLLLFQLFVKRSLQRGRALAELSSHALMFAVCERLLSCEHCRMGDALALQGGRKMFRLHAQSLSDILLPLLAEIIAILLHHHVSYYRYHNDSHYEKDYTINLLQPPGIELANFPFRRVRLLLNISHLALMEQIQAVDFGLQNLGHLLLKLCRFQREKLKHLKSQEHMY